MKLLRKYIPSFLTAVFLLLTLVPAAFPALLDVGPTVPEVLNSTPPQHGYPLWYRDGNRVPLEICLSKAISPNVPGSYMCDLLLGPTFDPSLTISFPGNFPDEAFWWSGGATIKNGIIRASLVMAIEGAWSTGNITPGDQITFARIRYVVDAPVAGTYRIIHPYGQKTFFNVPTGIHGIFDTEDIGVEVGKFTGALQGGVGPFLTWDSGIPINVNGELFIGDPNVIHTVTGSPAGTNFFRIEGPPGSNLDGLGNDFVQTNLFAITGKIYTPPIPTPVKGDRVTYARDANGMQLSVFTTANPISNATNSAAPFPANMALLNTPTVLQVSGVGIPTTNLATNTTPDGKFFAVTGSFTDPPTIPATVQITNTADAPPSITNIPLTDEIAISKATYNRLTNLLTIAASSSDRVASPTLQAFMPGLAAPLGTLANGQLNVTFPVIDNTVTPNKTYAIPPQTITLSSSKGGSATAPVSHFFPPLFSINAAAGPNGSISPAGATTVTGGTNQTYTITPNAGFMVAALVVDGTQLPGATSYTFTNVAASHYINAYFTQSDLVVTAAADANGTISPAGVTPVTPGGNLTYTITPNAGFMVAALVVDGTQLPGATSYTFTSVAASHFINAYFAPSDLAVTAAAGLNGTISPAGITAVTPGASQTYTITPNAGFIVAALVVDGTQLPGATSYSFTNVAASHYINAYFAPSDLVITAAAAADGSISPAGATPVTPGGNITYTITPNPGFQVAALVVDGTQLPGATSYTFSNVAASHYINAYFEALPTFTITAAAAANGSISQAGATAVTTGSNQTYTITPNPGFTVVALVVDGTQLAGATTYTFTNVTASHYINAYFAPIPTFAISAAAAANGSISPAGITAVTTGADQTYTITPNPGFTVAALVVDGTQLAGATTHTFTNVTGDHYINAYFEPLPTFAITAGAGANGSISPAGVTTVTTGGNQTYNITPDPGFIVSVLVVDGTEIPGVTSYTFTNVTGDHYINAYFQ